MAVSLDTHELEAKVKDMYRHVADIVSEQQLKESIVCDASLWAPCIGGAAQEDAYRQAIENAGLRIDDIKQNPYEFISDQARSASDKYGVNSVSVLAINA